MAKAMGNREYSLDFGAPRPWVKLWLQVARTQLCALTLTFKLFSIMLFSKLEFIVFMKVVHFLINFSIKLNYSNWISLHWNITKIPRHCLTNFFYINLLCEPHSWLQPRPWVEKSTPKTKLSSFSFYYGSLGHNVVLPTQYICLLGSGLATRMHLCVNVTSKTSN